jgi:hypothetical protein
VSRTAEEGLLVGLDLEKPIPEPRPDVVPAPPKVSAADLTVPVLLAGVIAGATFAVGSGIVQLYLFGRR